MQNRNILLIYPGELGETDLNVPLSLILIAKPLLGNGWSIKILDTRVEKIEYVELNDFFAVGISTMSGPQLENAIKTTRYIKQMNPQIHVIWGGPHPTLAPKQTVESDLVDIAVIGEGEEVFLKLLECLYNNEDYSNLRGIAYTKDGDIIINQAADFVDINTINLLPYQILDINKYPLFKEKFEYFATKGCPFNCRFCSSVANSGRKWRYKSPDIVMAELDYYYDKFNFKSLSFIDAEFFINKEVSEKIINEITKRGWGIPIYSMCRCDIFLKFGEKFWEKARDAGFKQLAFGAESGSSRVLEYINKQITLDMIHQTAEICQRLGIVAIFSLMGAIPTETEEEFNQTLELYDLIKKKYPSAMFNAVTLFTPFPGADLAIEAEKYGYKPPTTLEQWTHWEWSNEKNIPWVNHRFAAYIQTASILVRYFFVRDYFNQYDVKEKVARYGNVSRMILGEIFNLLFLPFAWIRWKLRYFKYSYELDLWFVILKKFTRRK